MSKARSRSKKEKVNTQAVDSGLKPERRHDIDWLRLLAVGLLFPFHTARIFDVWGNFYAKNDQLSNALTYLLGYLNQWHMPLFFLLAGASTWFALRFRSGGRYVKERFLRLLIPFIFGVLVIVPPQSYLGLRNHSDYAQYFWQWYPHFFQPISQDLDGYFLGGFTLGHLWFIFYLFIFSLVALPLFLYLNSQPGQRATARLAAFFNRPGAIFLLGFPVFAMSRILDFYPDPFYFITFFIYGYLLMTDGRFGEAIDRYKALALILGPVVSLIRPYFDIFGWPESIPHWSGPILSIYFEGFVPWFCLIAILGYGKQFLNFTNKFLKYGAEASYPFYTLHQTLIIIVGFYVVQWRVGVPAKYATILVGAFVASVVLYDLAIKRNNVIRFLFGMRLRKKPAK